MATDAFAAIGPSVFEGWDILSVAAQDFLVVKVWISCRKMSWIPVVICNAEFPEYTGLAGYQKDVENYFVQYTMPHKLCFSAGGTLSVLNCS